MGKSTISIGLCSIAMLNYQGVFGFKQHMIYHMWEEKTHDVNAERGRERIYVIIYIHISIYVIYIYISCHIKLLSNSTPGKLGIHIWQSEGTECDWKRNMHVCHMLPLPIPMDSQHFSRYWRLENGVELLTCSFLGKSIWSSQFAVVFNDTPLLRCVAGILGLPHDVPWHKIA